MNNTYQTGDATKNKILLSGRRLFYKKGYRNTTYDNISRDAHINRALIPYHFKGKDRLAFTIYKEIYRESQSLLDDILDIGQFSQDFQGVLRLTACYRLLADASFARFLGELLQDTDIGICNGYEADDPLQILCGGMRAMTENQFQLLCAAHAGIHREMVRSVHNAPQCIDEAVKLHAGILLRYAGKSEKKADELILAVGSVMHALSFVFDREMHVSIICNS